MNGIIKDINIKITCITTALNPVLMFTPLAFMGIDTLIDNIYEIKNKLESD